MGEIDIKERLKNGNILLLDGAMGTQLILRGIKSGETSETWILTRPDDVSAIHKDYFDAGADIVLTNTFGGTPLKLSHFGLAERAEDVNRRAAELAKSVCPEGRFVAGDIGPTGKLLKPYGDADEEELFENFKLQAKALADGGVDLVIIETMMDLKEGELALKAALTTELPVFACVTFDKKKRGYFTMMGNSPEDVVKSLIDLGATAVGANCTLRIGDMVDLIKEISAVSTVPVIAEPNAGSPELENGKPKYMDGPKEFAQKVPDLISAGAVIVGGCCGTTPETTREIRKIIDSM
ncbi:MAG: homocysteine S-methyltransferase family protein [Deltaproteobacteria bacterium]|uniref:Homocysteine S-methyltransferase family protein n=1 Tax=Candidatus Zymogenus saltonus TaxID=2844893 RepID=A0A9D8KHJ1_9DELT|nr:homocysteine S-methyltransferase family protein [Candidatus Zymogenus saltonus]